MIKNIFAIFALAFGSFTLCHAEQKFQPHESIYELVRETISQNISPSAEYEISLLPLDSQLKLPKCTEALEAFTTSASMNAGRTAIGVRCNAEKKWSIFISAVIKIYETVAVLSQSVQRGEIITPEHLTLEKRDVSKLRGDFIAEIDRIENKQAARYMPAGVILGQKSFTESKLVKRGEKIIISASQPGFNIRMNGIAMMDGTKGQLIRIKNENSGRIINATVVEFGLVSVK
jgi:flagellar basal body P-ring formation protein FlgA